MRSPKTKRKLQFQQGQIVELKERNKKLTQKNEEIIAENEIAATSVEDYLNITKEVFEQCNRTFSFETKSQADLFKALGQVINTFFNICRSNKTLVQAFIKGNEKLGAKASRKKQNDLNNRIKKTSRSIR